ncbi:MAG: SDR family oxidoreductase [Candidatus Omnitrophota bacterium]|nr:SDR family oxidoreductase [Candidatus Omnitrophota bacterium]
MKNKLLDKFGLKGKVVLITGTSKGLGRSIAEGLLEAGADVVALDRSENDYLPKLGKRLGVVFERIKVDLLQASEKDLEKVVNQVKKEFSRLDILINSAGISRRGEVEDFSDTDWQDVLKINLTVPFYLSRVAAKIFIKQRSGKIINLASMLSFQGGLRVPSYVASKHGIIGLTKSFANGLGKYGINVNAVAPGFMATDLTLPLQQDQKRNAAILQRISLGRWGKGEDLKGIVIFLSSPMSDYLNGAVIPVDGGYLCA